MPFLSANIPKKRREFMAVEARHMGFFSQQLADNRDNRMEATSMDDYYNLLQVRHGMPLSATDAVDNSAFIPMYSSGVSDYLPPRTPLKSDTGVTYNVPAGSRKRSRESPSGLFPYSTVDAEGIQRDAACCGSSFSFLGEDISHQIQQQQLDVDRIIAQHTEKVRLDIEEKRRNQARRILEAIEQRLMKRLRTKDEEIQKMVKFNYALEERIESLSVENQIWRNLAQTNEATANALRTKLEQVLAHVKDDHTAAMDNYAVAENPLMDDALSCCDSCCGDERPEHVESSQRAEEVESAAARDRRFCRNCGKREARVLLLPCRHLCLCGVCGSSVHTCPVCKAAKTASVHVNVS